MTLEERADRIDELQRLIWRLEWALRELRRELAEMLRGFLDRRLWGSAGPLGCVIRRSPTGGCGRKRANEPARRPVIVG
jgi:hypothetical protein